MCRGSIGRHVWAVHAHAHAHVHVHANVQGRGVQSSELIRVYTWQTDHKTALEATTGEQPHTQPNITSAERAKPSVLHVLVLGATLVERER